MKTEDGADEGALDGSEDGVSDVCSEGRVELMKEGKLDGTSDGTKPTGDVDGDAVVFTVPTHPKSTGDCDVTNVGKSEGTVDGN